MTNFYFGALLEKDVKKVTDTNDAEAEKMAKKTNALFSQLPISCPELSDYDSASKVLKNLGYDSQLVAIRKLLKLHKVVENDHLETINEAEEYAKTTTGIRNDYAVEHCIDLMHESAYQDAAHSMAAVGMLAPFVESLFYQAFCGIQKTFFEGVDLPNSHDRWQQPEKYMWDCHYVLDKGIRRRGIVEGILQTAEGVGLKEYLPNCLKQTLSALFSYRNMMFHNGFEWPIEKRKKFAESINNDWPKTWFQSATVNNEPWIFYLSDDFIVHCCNTIEEVFKGIGRFCNKLSCANHNR